MVFPTRAQTLTVTGYKAIVAESQLAEREKGVADGVRVWLHTGHW